MKLKTSVNKKYDFILYQNMIYKDANDRVIKYMLLGTLFLVNFF